MRWYYLLPVLALGWVGCAGTQPQAGQNTAGPVAPAPVAGQPKPEAIYVYDFSLDLSKLSAAGDRAILVRYREALRRAVTARLLEILNREKIPAFSYGKDLPLPSGNFWLLDGRFVRIDGQDHALGLFQSRSGGPGVADAAVEVADLSRATPQRILIFETAGAATAEDLSDTDASAALEREALRIASQIAAYLKNYYLKQGWL